jgi:foldase protein PrsA
MRRTLRILLPVCLLGVAPLALAACGGDDSDSLPSNAVAKVGDVSITKTQFDHWMNVAATATAAQTGQTGDVAKVPDPPEFQQCIAARKKAEPKPEKGQPRTTDAQYREQCEQTYEQLRSTVMTFLITSQWIEQEAADRNIKVTDQQVEKELDKLKEQQFQKESEYEDFLKSQGMTNDDVLFQQRLTMLRQKLQEQITKGKDKVTDAQIQQYYDKNKQRFATPETRDVRIVLTKTEAKAEEAKQALESGESWKDVAKEYSIDDASKDSGGKLEGIAKGQQEQALDDAIFSAQKGELSGPVKTQFGWYVFEVEKITPAEQQSLEDAKETIKQIITSENQQKALTQFEENWKKQFTAETVCRADFEVAECENAPKTSTATTPTGATQPTG